jgi:hypothetical protein
MEVNDKVLGIDADGKGGQASLGNLVMLPDVHTDLETLTQSHQIIV